MFHASSSIYLRSQAGSSCRDLPSSQLKEALSCHSTPAWIADRQTYSWRRESARAARTGRVST